MRELLGVMILLSIPSILGYAGGYVIAVGDGLTDPRRTARAGAIGGAVLTGFAVGLIGLVWIAMWLIGVE